MRRPRLRSVERPIAWGTRGAMRDFVFMTVASGAASFFTSHWNISDMRQTDNLHVVDTTPLVTPQELRTELRMSPRVAEVVASTRDAIRAILRGDDHRLLAVVGPCSIHDVDAARDYADHLMKARKEFGSELLLVMRVYFEKPRTTIG